MCEKTINYTLTIYESKSAVVTESDFGERERQSQKWFTGQGKCKTAVRCARWRLSSLGVLVSHSYSRSRRLSHLLESGRRQSALRLSNMQHRSSQQASQRQSAALSNCGIWAFDFCLLI
ncbi:Uncharacterized protein Adt_17520 [Abeliophyllum distichum]|uniref:Uncharacterized protein n=1 Tax=Abeliophyllum distichum TaxID=126358 RepID=A0ABD1TGQ3_9LAMI